MKIYIYSCSDCTWKGNRAHADGQCPVCGQGLDIDLRKRRFSYELSPKLKVSGLTADKKLLSVEPVKSFLRSLSGLDGK